MVDVRSAVKGEVATELPAEILPMDVSALRGVGSDAAGVLSDLGITTVYDLATSSVFGAAAALADPEGGPGALWERTGMVPADVLDPDVPRNTDGLIRRDASALRWVSDNVQARLEQAVGITTIEDLAWWGPFRSARALVKSAFPQDGGDSSPDGIPADLLPGSDDYAIEKHFYSLNIFDRFYEEPTEVRELLRLNLNLRGLDAAAFEHLSNSVNVPSLLAHGDEAGTLPGAGQIDLLAAAQETSDVGLDGFSVPAVGARVTYEQNWHRQGLALGQLLHSLSLAPGEMTKVAVVDWTRRSEAQLAETATETESLASTLEQARSVSEITNAVATEAQSGFSQSRSSASTSSGSAGLGFSGGGFSLGASGSTSGSSSRATTVTASGGRRTAAADLNQEIASSTQQAASSERSRRASVVREVEQSESEQIKTRIVANYNHMHALSMHYYEVVQVYRVVTRIQKMERLLFVPLKPLDFRDPRTVRRWRRRLLRAALTPVHRRLIEDAAGKVTLTQQPADVSGRKRERYEQLLSELRRKQGELGLADSETARILGAWVEGEQDEEEQRRLRPEIKALRGRVERARREYRAFQRRRQGQAARNAKSYEHLGVEGDGLRRWWKIPAEASLVAVANHYHDENVTEVAIHLDDGEVVRTEVPNERPWSKARNTYELDRPVDIARVERIVVHHGPDSTPADLPYRGIPLDLLGVIADDEFRLRFWPAVDRNNNEPGEFVLATAEPARSTAELADRLNEERLHYSQAIWSELTPQEVALTLGHHTLAGRSLIEQIDPTPVGVYGNYLLFRWHHDDDSWVTWKADQLEATGASTELVPIPTGGVFAEAVLGRANAAEKLDITRFWNWQDSPIPHAAPDIAAVQSGSRATAEELSSPQFGTPVVALMNPQQLPDPSSLNAMVQAVSSGFRDMSGVAENAQLAGLLSNNATQAGIASGVQAGAALREAATTERAKIKAAAQVATAALGAPAGSAGATQSAGAANPTYTGAMIEHGRKLDGSTGASGGGPDGSGAPAPAGPGGGRGSGGGRGGARGPDIGSGAAAGSGETARTASHEARAFNQGVSPAHGAAEATDPISDSESEESAADDAPAELESELHTELPPSGTPSREHIATIYFKTGQPHGTEPTEGLGHDDREILGQVASDPRFAEQRWTVVGYTDPRPDRHDTPGYNDDLALRRAWAVAVQLLGPDAASSALDTGDLTLLSVAPAPDAATRDDPRARRAELWARPHPAMPDLPDTQDPEDCRTDWASDHLKEARFAAERGATGTDLSVRNALRTYVLDRRIRRFIDQGGAFNEPLSTALGSATSTDTPCINRMDSLRSKIVHRTLIELKPDTERWLEGSSSFDAALDHLETRVRFDILLRTDAGWRTVYLDLWAGTTDASFPSLDWFRLSDDKTLFPPPWDELSDHRQQRLTDQGLAPDGSPAGYMSGLQHRTFLRDELGLLRDDRRAANTLLDAPELARFRGVALPTSPVAPDLSDR